MLLKTEKAQIQKSKVFFLRTGFCAHEPQFREYVVLYDIEIETCGVCNKEFKRVYLDG